MIIIVNVSEEYYEKIKEKSVFGKELLVETDFIHARSSFHLLYHALKKTA